MKANKMNIKVFTISVVLYFGMMAWGLADIYINVVAVNGKDEAKTSNIHFDLPGELTAEDVLDTNGLQLDYDVDDANYFVYGEVTFKPKESKVFRVLVKDKWMITSDQVADLKEQIDKGYVTLGLPYNADNAKILKTRLYSKLDYIIALQSNNVDSTDKRIDAYRAYVKEMKRIRNNALDVAYWRSDPGVDKQPKLIHLSIEVKNPTLVTKPFKHKDYLPQEVKSEDVVDAEGFEVRYDQIKQLSFLFKEEDLAPGEDKKYSIGIIDIWSVDQRDIDYLRSRAKKSYDFLKDFKYKDVAQILWDRITTNLDSIEASQAVQRPILEHISVFRANKVKYNETEKDVETLEKLLSVSRENLTKTKIENILAKIKALKTVSDISKTIFNKQFQDSEAWAFIKWILLFVAVVTFVNFGVWLRRSKDKKITNEQPKENLPKDDLPPEKKP